MNKKYHSLLLFISCAALTACSGSSTQVLDYTPVDNSPKLNMAAAIYTSALPSGKILTLTTDQSGTAVYGAYTIKDSSGTILSSGKIDNLVTSLSLTGFSCPTEAISINPDSKSISPTFDSASAIISGFSCTDGNLSTTSTIAKVKNLPASSRMFSQGTISSTGQKLEVSVTSGDNVNFVGYVTLTNTLLSISATGTIVGTITTSSAAPASGGIITRINDPSAYGFAFTRTTNFSGHFFDLSDNIQTVTGNVRTSPTAPSGQFFINEITVQTTNNGSLTTIGPVTSTPNFFYTPQ